MTTTPATRMFETLEGRTLNSVTVLAAPDALTAETAAPALTVDAGTTAGSTTTSSPKLAGEILSNVSKTRSEISMTFARNARA